ncbi:hypothetical protein FHT00_000644 [Sphingomonas insulae]|nr:hypothetical protein [Sphingomonas insulae]
MITPTTSAWAAIASMLLAAVSNMRMEGLRCRRNIRQARYVNYCSFAQYYYMQSHMRFTQL